MQTPAHDFSAITIGALVGLLVDISLTAFGAGVGLISIPWEDGAVSGTAAIASLVVGLGLIGAISFAVGGYVAGRLAGGFSRWHSGLHGVAAFALATVFTVTAGSAIGFSLAGVLAERATTAAGAATGASAMLSELGRLRIVTDLSILRGRAVTELVVPGTPQAGNLDRLIGEANRSAQNAINDPQLQADAAQVAEDARQGAGAAGLGFFLLLLGGSAASAWGGVAGGRHAARAAGALRSTSQSARASRKAA